MRKNVKLNLCLGQDDFFCFHMVYYSANKLIAGLPESMIKVANEKTHNIVKAYELIPYVYGLQAFAWQQSLPSRVRSSERVTFRVTSSALALLGQLPIACL